MLHGNIIKNLDICAVCNLLEGVTYFRKSGPTEIISITSIPWTGRGGTGC
jgi:hypothetical protein